MEHWITSWSSGVKLLSVKAHLTAGLMVEGAGEGLVLPFPPEQLGTVGSDFFIIKVLFRKKKSLVLTYMLKKNSYKVFRKRSFKRKPTKRAPRTKKATTALVKRVITRLAEKKIQTYTINTVSPLVLRSGSASSSANIFSMTPEVGYWAISQGTGQADRIGDKVRTRSAILNIQMTPAVYNATTNPTPTPCFVRLWFLKSKFLPADVVPSSSVYGASATYLQTGNSSTGLTGTFQDLQLYINKDQFTYYGHRTYKIAPSIYEGTGATPTAGNFGNNDFKLCILDRINLTRWFPKTLQWDDAGLACSSHNLTLVVQPIFSTGVAPGALIAPINLKFSLTYTFTDI